MPYRCSIHNRTYRFESLRTLMAKASSFRSGDALAGLTANSYEERVAAQMALADVPLKNFLEELLIPYETDEITRLIIDDHDTTSFSIIAHLTVGGLRDWLLSEEVNTP